MRFAEIRGPNGCRFVKFEDIRKGNMFRLYNHDGSLACGEASHWFLALGDPTPERSVKDNWIINAIGVTI